MDIFQLETLIENNEVEQVIALLSQKPLLAAELTSNLISPVLLACYYQKQDLANSIAAYIPKLNIFDACALGKLAEVNTLIINNSSLLSTYSADGFTPLGLACYFAHEDVVAFLLSRGAEVNLPSKNGFNVFPIHSAVAANNIKITRLLLDKGAYPNVCQKSGVAPLHTAAQLGNIELIILLLEHGAEVTLRMEGGKLPSDLAADKGFKEIADILRPED